MDWFGTAAVALVALGDDACAVFRPENTGDALVNPGMGWVCFHHSNRLWAYGSRTEHGGTPVIALPLPEGDGVRRYRIGEIAVNAQR